MFRKALLVLLGWRLSLFINAIVLDQAGHSSLAAILLIAVEGLGLLFVLMRG